MELLKGSVVTLAPGSVLRVERGAVWLTQYPDPADYFLASGESKRLERPGAAVISALRESNIRVVAPPKRRTLWTDVLSILALRPRFGA